MDLIIKQDFSMIYLLLADGFEEIETLGTIDILRRCNLQVQTLSVTGKRVVVSARGVVIKADSLYRKNHMDNCEAIILPGGLKGAETLEKNVILRQTLQAFNEEGVLIAAICAAPMVLGTAGILDGKHATIYPGMEDHIQNAIYHHDGLVVIDGNIITACGPAATPMFAFSIARYLHPNEMVVGQVEIGMCFQPNDYKYRILKY